MAYPTIFVAVLAMIPSLHATNFLPFLNFTSSSPLIFHSLASLLQVQPQTLFPNGHTIASVTIPRHTLLYHGRHDLDPVPSPEWLAMDMEMAYAIMGSLRDSRMLTYRTTKNIRAVYFDGTSASLTGEGTFSQMVFIYNGTEDIPKRSGWGPSPPGRGPHDHNHEDAHEEEDLPRRPPGKGPPPRWNPLKEEYFRARELCKWLQVSGLGGKGWGYEGIVRMNAGFELIWCNFDSPSLKLVSNLNVSAPRLSVETPVSAGSQPPNIRRPSFMEAQSRLNVNEDEGPHGPGMTDPREPFRNTSNWFWFSAAAKRYAGDSRIRIDSSGIFSFYEPGLYNQTRDRTKTDVENLNLRADGKWKSRFSTSHWPGSLTTDSKRSKEWEALLKRGRHHRLTSVDEKDGSYMRHSVEERLRKALEADSAGNDWHFVAKEITAQYGNELRRLLHYLGQASQSSMDDWIFQVRQLTHWFMLPFLEYPPKQPYEKHELQNLFGKDSPAAQQSLERCVSQYNTGSEVPTPEDAVMSEAVKETLLGICSTVIKIGLDIEYHWFYYFEPEQKFSDERVEDAYSCLTHKAQTWKEEMQELLAWLGWAEQWSSCEMQCDIDEICYIPMWPISGWDRRGRWDSEDLRFLWEPVCVSMENYPPEERNSLTE